MRFWRSESRIGLYKSKSIYNNKHINDCRAELQSTLSYCQVPALHSKVSFLDLQRAIQVLGEYRSQSRCRWERRTVRSTAPFHFHCDKSNYHHVMFERVSIHPMKFLAYVKVECLLESNLYWSFESIEVFSSGNDAASTHLEV